MTKLLFPLLLLLTSFAWSQTYSNIDDQTNTDNGTTGWGSCTATNCAGGANPANVFSTDLSTTYYVPSSNPNDVTSRQFYISGPQYADALWWYKLGPNNNVTTFTFDFWVLVDTYAASAAQALEFDAFQYVNGRKFTFGTQCLYATGQWQVWNGGSNQWVNAGVACPKLTAGDWYHITWKFHRSSNKNNKNMYYDSVQVLHYDSTGTQQQSTGSYSASVNKTEQAGPLPSGWSNNLGVQFQLDLNGIGGQYNEWVDLVSLTAQ